jgi:hypothetical protein
VCQEWREESSAGIALDLSATCGGLPKVINDEKANHVHRSLPGKQARRTALHIAPIAIDLTQQINGLTRPNFKGLF